MSTQRGAGETDEVTAATPDATTSEYLDGLRAALSDLPPDELAEVTEDARGHLGDLAAELGADYDRSAVHARLGPPAEYAAELRAAAGFPAAPAPSHSLSRWSARFAVLALLVAVVLAGPAGMMGASGAGAGVLILALFIAGVGVLAVLRDGPRLRAVAELESVAALRGRLSEGRPPGGVAAFLVSLQPGWWVLRGVTGAGVLVVIVGGATSWELWVAVLLALVAIPVSVWLGGRTRADRRLLWLVVPLNAFAVGALAGLAVTLSDPPDGDASAATWTSPGLTRDGMPVEDIRPFDSAGRPLSGVYLFDQDGRPLTVRDTGCAVGSDRTASPGPGPYPGGTTSYDSRTGACVQVPPGPMVVSIPGAAPTTAASPTPASPTPAATPLPAGPRPSAPATPGPR